jgi:LysM repeat protein
MNNQSPLVPQGSLVEQKNKGRARLRIVVFFILAVHGIGLLALLMQGCKQDKGTADGTAETANTNPPPALEATNPVVATSPAPSTATTAAATSTPPPLVQPAPPSVPQEYTIVSGDKFSTLAKRFGISTKALEEANPGVEPTKLQIGEKIHVPAPVVSATSAPAAASAPADTTDGEQMYTVKSGDTLSSIGRQFGVRIRAIRAANNLTTDRIVVGQKLKIPAKTGAATTLATNQSDGGSGTPAGSTTPTR